MSAQTGISWCDSTFNPWKICNPVGPGCKNCYAAALSKRFGWGEYAPGVPRQRTSAANWKLPLRWSKNEFYECTSCGWRGDTLGMVGDWHVCPKCESKDTETVRRRVFCASLADWLDNEAPIEWLVDFLDLVRRTPNLDWLLLTKRIGNWRPRLEQARNHGSCSVALMNWLHDWLTGNPPAHVWIGATVVNQDEADRDVPKLLAVPACVRFLSIEPMLGLIDLSGHLWGPDKPCPGCPKDADCECGWQPRHMLDGQASLHWIICGGESGPHARPMHPAWVLDLRDQCAGAGVPLHFKQWGEWEPRSAWSGHLGGGRFEPMLSVMLDGSQCPHDVAPQDVGAFRMAKVGTMKSGRTLDGVEHNGFPQVSA